MNLESLLGDDAGTRTSALAQWINAPEHERIALSAELAAIAIAAADALADADENGKSSAEHAVRLGHACVALSTLRGEVARGCLMRIADERSYAVKAALARALRETRTAEGRAVLVHLLSDDDAQADAIVAIGAAPWPEVLPALIEIAELDDRAARLAARAIAHAGSIGGEAEANAAADFLLDQLDDDAVLSAATDALLRFGGSLPGVTEKAARLAATTGKRRVAGLCLLAGAALEARRDAPALPTSGAGKTDVIEARSFLGPLLKDRFEPIRRAAEETWKALDLA